MADVTDERACFVARMGQAAGGESRIEPRMPRPRFIPVAALIAFAVLAVMVLDRRPNEQVTGQAWAVDGDSLVVGGRGMRIRGIDAPELRQTCTIGGHEEPCGRQAAQALRRWLARGAVTCVGGENDRYGRLLVVCRVNGTDIGADLVRNGLAVDYGDYPAEESEARAAHRGIWAGTFERPEAWRRRARETAGAPMP